MLKLYTKNLIRFFCATLVSGSLWALPDPGSVTFGGAGGVRQKHIVLIAGDEGYRSEEALVQLAKILSVRHGFACTVLFSLADDGTIDPRVQKHVSHPAALDSADAIVVALRFRAWPDEAMRHFVDAYLAGKPIVALRTSTHAFKYPADSVSEFRKYSFDSKEWAGGFGRQVLGETWAGHRGANYKEATRGIPEPSAARHPLLRGVGTVFSDTGAYNASPASDVTVLLRGAVLTGINATSPLDATGKNDPMQPIAWSRMHRNERGNVNRVMCTTLGSSTDILEEGFRRLLVNAVYWGLGQEVPAKADVGLVGDFSPSAYGNKFQPGVRPANLALPVSEFKALKSRSSD